jgi:soluble lytic murein transglycosylase
MMAARNTLLLIGLSALLAGCFDRDKPSGKLKYDDSAQGANGSYDSGATDTGGNSMGSNEPVPPQDSTPVALKAEVDENWPPPRFEPVTYKAMSARRLSYAGQIMRIANANGVEVELAHAIITQESKYKAGERSPAGAMGLMQLMPGAARRWDCSQPFNAECNLNAGNRYLRFLADMFNGNVRTIAAGYNAGEGVADSYLRGIPDRISKLDRKNPTGIKTPNGVPLASFGYFKYQKQAGCPSNNWHPTEKCEGQTYDYVRRVLGYYLTYKQHPELIGKTVEPAPSAVAHRQGRI